MTPEQFAAERTTPAPSVPYTPAQLAAAREVRTRYGWYDILQVNGNSVSVNGDFGDVRIPLATVIEVR